VQLRATTVTELARETERQGSPPAAVTNRRRALLAFRPVHSLQSSQPRLPRNRRIQDGQVVRAILGRR